MAVKQLITNNIDLWSSTIKKKSATGRGSSKKIELYGIKKLRELILELAVRGKLVPQDPTDEPASELLKRIKAEKAQLTKDKKIRKTKTFPEISEDETPFKIPSNWSFIRFIDVLDFSGGGQPPKSVFSDVKLDGYVQLIQIRDLGPKPQPVYIPKDKASKFCTKDDVMVGRYGASVGKVFWGKEGAYNVALIRIHNDFNAYVNSYIFNLLKSPIGQNLFTGISRSAQDGFNKDDIAPSLLPLPPLKEQQRIVTKVDELMALCDQLESQTESSLEAHETLVQVLLSTLTDSKNSEELNKNWQRVSEYFDTLFTTEQSIDQLKQTILQLAVMGKLVPQSSNDEPASVLLEKIAEEKAQLIKDKKIKKQKPLPPISDEEKPFTLPCGWEWCYLDDVALSSSAGWSPQCLPTSREGHNWGVLKVSAVSWGEFRSEENKELPSHLAAKPEFEVMPNDFLISRANTVELVARAVIAPFDVPSKLIMSDKIIRFKFSDYADPNFLNIVNNSKFSRIYYEQVAGGTSSSMKNVSREQIRKLLVALPSLVEQRAIVSKVSSLMGLCEHLKTSISNAQTTQLNLTDAIVNSTMN